MIERTKAIVLNQIKYSDSSIIVNLLSRNYGRTAIIVKACRGKKSAVKANMFFPLNIIEVDLYYKQNRSLQTLKNADSIYMLNDISTNIYKTCITQFLAEIIQKSVKEETPNYDVFSFIEKSILTLEKSVLSASNFHVAFLINLAGLLGFNITNNYCKDTPFFNVREGMFLPLYTTNTESMQANESNYLSSAINLGLSNHFEIKIPYKSRQVILEYLIKYYKYHIIENEEIKSIKVLNAIFEN